MTEIQGTLEIDHERGVVYFHANDPDVAERYNTPTIVRISGLTKPIPEYRQIDIIGVQLDDKITWRP